MMPHIRDFQGVENVSIRFAQKVSIIVFLALYLLSGLLAGKEAVAQSNFGPQVVASNETNGAKKDFLFKQPKKYFGFRVGMFFPQADSDLFDMVTKELTLEKSDFRAWEIGIDAGFNLFERIDLVFRYDYSDRSKRSEFRNYVDEQGWPITQTTSFRESSLTAGIKYLFVPPGRAVGQLAWIPNRFVPFAEAGGGVLWYRFGQFGDFVDSETLEIFTATLRSSGSTFTGYLGTGMDIYLLSSTFLTLDLRYAWANHDLSGSFTGFDPIDLGGVRATAGINWHF